MSLSGQSTVPRSQNNSPYGSGDGGEFPRPAKRARIAVACTRCKSRKQKCDGGQPKCGNCKNLPAVCEYIVPSKTLPYGKYQYLKALEGRVAELEGLLANAGLPDRNKSQWDMIVQSEASNESSTLKGERASQPSAPGPSKPTTPSSSSKQPEDPSISDATEWMKNLSLQAGGGFVGDESSNVTLGNMFQSLLLAGGSSEDDQTDLTPKSSAAEEGESYVSDNSTNLLGTIPSEVAEKLMKGYLKHISTRWVAVYRPHVYQLHSRRLQLRDPYEISTLSLIYAIAGRFLETMGESGFSPERHYRIATTHLGQILKSPDQLLCIQTLLLHAIYCLRSPRGISSWTHIGLAIRVCIGLGMHRKNPNEQPSLASEIKKRVFWSCYSLDRQVSIILGRPFAISDGDIDVELPLDIDDSLSDAAIRKITNPDPNKHANPSTSLSCFIHMTRLRRLESSIQRAVYKVDEPSLLQSPEIYQFLSRLSDWKDNIPQEFPQSDTEIYSYDGYRYYEIYYSKCIRLLLYPHLSSPTLKTDLILRCATACGGVCRAYKAITVNTEIGFSLMALYDIFISGLTLLYCVWLSPGEIRNIQTTNDLNSCSIVLYVIAERWPLAKKYRDAFECLKSNILSITEHGSNNRAPIPNLSQDVILQDILGRTAQGMHPEGRVEFDRMMSDMTGQNTSILTAQSFQQQSWTQMGMPMTAMARRATAPSVTLSTPLYLQPQQQYQTPQNPFTVGIPPQFQRQEGVGPSPATGIMFATSPPQHQPSFSMAQETFTYNSTTPLPSQSHGIFTTGQSQSAGGSPGHMPLGPTDFLDEFDLSDFFGTGGFGYVP